MGKIKGRIEISENLCKGCGLCVSVCPEDNLLLSYMPDAKGTLVAILNDQKNCTACRFCAFICPDVAIEVFRLESDSMEEEHLQAE